MHIAVHHTPTSIGSHSSHSFINLTFFSSELNFGTARIKQAPSSGISVGGRGKHTCFYTSEYSKTTRDKIKTNQMVLVFILSRVVLIYSLV